MQTRQWWLAMIGDIDGVGAGGGSSGGENWVGVN